MELEVHFATGSRSLMAEQIDKVCQRDDKPDCIVVQTFKRAVPRFLKIAESHQMPVFLVNSGLSDLERESVCEPAVSGSLPSPGLLVGVRY